MFYIYPYKTASKSAKLLADALGVKRLKAEGSKFKGAQGAPFILNWGNTNYPPNLSPGTGAAFINSPSQVCWAVDKTVTYRKLGELTPTVWLDYASAWEMHSEGKNMLLRANVKGRGGVGIYYLGAEGGDTLDIVDFLNLWKNTGARLATHYIKKSKEYRVHVFGGQVILTQEKKAVRERIKADEVNWKVRNEDGGWVYGVHNVEAPDSVLDYARQAVARLRLNFGAVDVIWNDHYQEPYVLEVNTAPGLSPNGSALKAYVDHIRRYYM